MQMRLPIDDRVEYYQPPADVLPPCNWRPPSAQEVPPWADARRIAIDIETRDPDLRELGPGVRRGGSNRIVGVSFAIEDGPSYYLPIAHHGGDNCDWDVRQYLIDQFAAFNGEIVGANLSYDADWLAEFGCDILSKTLLDIQVADPLIYELHDRYSLEALCHRYGLPGKDERLLRDVAAMYRVDPKSGLWRLPARFVAAYAIGDVLRPLQILRRQEQAIEADDLQEIWTLERAVTPALIKVKRRGVRIDRDRLEQIRRLALMTEAQCLEAIKASTGVEIPVDGVWKPGDLAKVLEGAGYTVPLTPKSRKPSVDKDLLAKCGEIGSLILKARKWNKLRTTFVAQIDRAMIGDRIHCTYNQIHRTDDDGTGHGVRFGRFSAQNPNLQQQPVRDEEFGSLWRSIFIPDHGAQWACSDWSQQEPRIGVHYAELLGLEGAKEFADAYRADPTIDIHQKLADLCGMDRKIVKSFVNGRLYGMGDAKLCRQMGQPTEYRSINGIDREVAGPEGQRIIDQFRAYAPWIDGLTRAAAAAAERRGYVKTACGRKCHFEQTAGRYQLTHKAFNRVGQGSAADQMKATLVAADREGIPIQLAVHDEFDLSWVDERVIRRLKELQMTVVKFSVPMKVDLEVGPNWGELEKLK